MLNPVDSQNTDLIESPTRHSLCEFAIHCRDILRFAYRLDLGVKPLIAQHIGGTNDGEACRVAGLEGGYEGELIAGGPQVIEGFALLLRIVAVRCGGSAQDRGKEGTLAKGLAHSVGEGDGLAVRRRGTKEVLSASSDRSRVREKQYIVLVRGGVDVVVEMVDYEAGAVRG